MSDSEDDFQEASETIESVQISKPRNEAAAAAASAQFVKDGILLPSKPLDETPIEDTLKQPVNPPRTDLPCVRPKGHSGIWSVLKSAIGQDLSKIAMPVQYNEPISFIQRLAEDLEYSNLLDIAAEHEDSLVRLAHIAAFSGACFGSSANGHRIYKAFNPLLAETFELVRPQEGYRVVGEQVSHHPPITALHAESTKGWTLREEYKCDTKFRGTLKITPRGLARYENTRFNDRITWVKPATTVHNLVFGKIWVDNEGDVEVINHSTGEKCVVSWHPYSSVKSAFTRLYAVLYDAQGVIRYTMNGAWNQGLLLYEGHIPKDSLPSKDSQVMKCNKAKMTVWTLIPAPDKCKDMYGLTDYAMTLNQLQPNICPTDSRLRPDQRLLEDGDMDRATQEKKRLEDKQRKARKARENNNEEYNPRWFTEVVDPETKLPLHVYTGGYFDAKQKGEFADKDKWADIF